MPDLTVPYLNRVLLAGRLTRDPELRYTQSGKAVCTLGLAVARKTKDREETLFINAETWEQAAEYCGGYLKKGRPVIVEGRLRLREWESEHGKRSVIQVQAERVQVLDWEGDGQAESRPQPQRRREVAEPEADDDIPF